MIMIIMYNSETLGRPWVRRPQDVAGFEGLDSSCKKKQVCKAPEPESLTRKYLSTCHCFSPVV